jgi:hypothetical protein
MSWYDFILTDISSQWRAAYDADYLHPGNHGGRPSSVYNVIPSPKDEDDDKGTHHSGMFQKVLNKDSVRNALNLNSAASAFTKTSRSKNLGNIDMPTASLVMTGSAVPALWLRRDDKGRRPVRFFSFVGEQCGYFYVSMAFGAECGLFALTMALAKLVGTQNGTCGSLDTAPCVYLIACC